MRCVRCVRKGEGRPTRRKIGSGDCLAYGDSGGYSSTIEYYSTLVGVGFFRSTLLLLSTLQLHLHLASRLSEVLRVYRYGVST